jgi:hypothetical protein
LTCIVCITRLRLAAKRHSISGKPQDAAAKLLDNRSAVFVGARTPVFEDRREHQFSLCAFRADD